DYKVTGVQTCALPIFIFFAFIGMGVTLVLLQQGLHTPWTGALLLVMIAFFIQSAHSLVGGAASMDFGGKKAVATAAGLFDGAQRSEERRVGKECRARW